MNPIRMDSDNSELIYKSLHNMISIDTKFFISLGLFGSCTILLLGCVGLSVYHSDSQHNLARLERDNLNVKLFKAQEDLGTQTRDLKSLRRSFSALERQLRATREEQKNNLELKAPE